ncbi:MAG TPA: DUF2889 domain-containing protein [Acidimicrobiia bacterium]
MGAPYHEGSYRRRIRLATTEPGVVEGALEDDFHHFEVTLRVDRHSVVAVEARSVRWPWSTCPGAAVPLRALEGMELSPRCLAVGAYADPRANCTHMFDLAGLAVAHAARMGEGGAAARQYDAEVPVGATAGDPTRVRLERDGDLVLEWTLAGRGIADPPPFTEAPWHGGFFRWADATLPVDEAEAAIVLRRACEIGMGRGMDLDAYDSASELGPMMRGVCHTMQPGVMEIAVRNKGSIRDFSDRPDALLR